MINNNNPDVLAIFTSLLNLSDIEVTKIRESDNGRRITIAVKSTKEHVACRQCNKRCEPWKPKAEASRPR